MPNPLRFPEGAKLVPRLGKGSQAPRRDITGSGPGAFFNTSRIPASPRRAAILLVPELGGAKESVLVSAGRFRPMVPSDT